MRRRQRPTRHAPPERAAVALDGLGYAEAFVHFEDPDLPQRRLRRLSENLAGIGISKLLDGCCTKYFIISDGVRRSYRVLPRVIDHRLLIPARPDYHQART